MRRVMVTYRVKPDLVEENEALVRAVYEELRASDPDPPIRYSTRRLEDGVTFVHLHEGETGDETLQQLPAFKLFQAEIRERCDEPPKVSVAELIGSFPEGEAG